MRIFNSNESLLKINKDQWNKNNQLRQEAPPNQFPGHTWFLLFAKETNPFVKRKFPAVFHSKGRSSRHLPTVLFQKQAGHCH